MWTLRREQNERNSVYGLDFLYDIRYVKSIEGLLQFLKGKLKIIMWWMCGIFWFDDDWWIIFTAFIVNVFGSYLGDRDDDSENEWHCPHCDLAMNLDPIQNFQHMETCQQSKSQQGNTGKWH